MNSLHLLLGSALLALSLVGCETTGSGGGASGRTIMYPTVDQMARLEKEWGMEPRQVRPRGSGNYDTEVNYDSIAPRQAPSNSAPPPQPNMLPPAPEPVLDPPQPSVDPATIQKLR